MRITAVEHTMLKISLGHGAREPREAPPTGPSIGAPAPCFSRWPWAFGMRKVEYGTFPSASEHHIFAANIRFRYVNDKNFWEQMTYVGDLGRTPAKTTRIIGEKCYFSRFLVFSICGGVEIFAIEIKFLQQRSNTGSTLFYE